MDFNHKGSKKVIVLFMGQQVGTIETCTGKYWCFNMVDSRYSVSITSLREIADYIEVLESTPLPIELSEVL